MSLALVPNENIDRKCFAGFYLIYIDFISFFFFARILRRLRVESFETIEVFRYYFPVGKLS